MSKHIIFISYSRKDLAFVKTLHRQLESRGLTAWFDQMDIPPGDQWREAIVRAITDCKIFLLVLSPAAVHSKHVRKELDLAERRNKTVVPVVWEHTALPAALEYQLVGIQYFDFDGHATTENFAKLAKALHTVLNTPREKSLYLSTWKQKSTSTAEKYSRLVIARVITPLAMNVALHDKIGVELHWLFAAAQHFVEIRRGKYGADTPVPVAIPPHAKTHPHANNRLLPNIDDFSLRMAEGQIISLFKQLRTYLQNLTFEVNREISADGTAEDAIIRQNSIKAQRQIIVERIRRMAKLVRDLYGVALPGPDTLGDYLDMMSN